MKEILTPERVLELGQAWKKLLIQQTPNAEMKALLSTELKQELIDQGIEQGEAAMRQTLVQLLQRRFGAVPTVVHEGLQHCTLTELNALVNPALDATTWSEFLAALPNATS